MCIHHKFIDTTEIYQEPVGRERAIAELLQELKGCTQLQIVHHKGKMPANAKTRSVGVTVRIRPGTSETAAAAAAAVAKDAVTSFQFEKLIEGSDQASAAAALLSDLIHKFIHDGMSCTLMAYGQTGSGKTYTMFGPTGSLTETALQQAAGAVPEAWGAFPRAMMQLLGTEELAAATWHASAIEIYMEQAYDLLDGRKPIKVCC